MTTKIQLLEFDWYFSYGAGNKIDFTENTVTQILGPNGYGKSSIPLILEEICYNKNSKGISKAEIPNRYGPGGTWGRLTFTKDDDLYVIETDRKTSIKVKLSKNGEDISSHTATGTFKLIEDLLGNDFKTFSQLVYQNTNSSLQFLSATDTNRKKFLIDLLHLEEYVGKFDAFKDAVKTASTEVVRIQAQIETVESWLKSNKADNLEEIELDYVDTDTSTLEKDIAKLSLDIANIKKSNSLIAQNNKYKELLQGIDIAAITALPFNEMLSYDEEQKQLGSISGLEKAAATHLKKLRGLADTCPTCEQCVDTEFKSNLIAEEEDKVKNLAIESKKLSDSIASIKNSNEQYSEKARKIKDWEELYRSIDFDLPTEAVDKADLEKELTKLELELNQRHKDIEAVRKHNEAANKQNSRIQVIVEQTETFKNQLSTLEKSLEKKMHLLSLLEILKKAFSTNGLLAYKIENLVKDLEELTNEYLAELSDGRFTIDFSVVSDKLNVNITDNFKSININALSSGELARVNTATLLALRKLMNSLSKSKINVLFLDEVISVLDEQGKEKLIEVLLEEDLNTYIVSHSWQHPLVSKLEIIKENNISRIEYA
jgi:DNA repair exonuclease SbcCD ATPase subunit